MPRIGDRSAWPGSRPDISGAAGRDPAERYRAYAVLVITTAGDHITAITGFPPNVMARFGSDDSHAATAATWINVSSACTQAGRGLRRPMLSPSRKVRISRPCPGRLLGQGVPQAIDQGLDDLEEFRLIR